MPPKVFKILDYITDGVKSSSKYWDDAVRTAREASHVTSDLRVPINSVQRNGYSNLQHAKSQYKYFQNPRLARYDFEQIAPLSEFQRYLPKGQVGDPFGVMKLLEGTTNPYLRSVHRELKSFYPIGKQLQLSPTEIQRQMDLRLRDLFNNMYRVNTPMIFKMGGKIEKHQLGKIIRPIKKGIKNLQIYMAYTKNPENFYGPVQRTLDHYTTRYPALQTNYFSRNLHGSFVLDPYKPKFDIPEISIKKNPFSGVFGQYSRDNKIMLYPYSLGSIVNAWKNPKKAIYHMNGVAAHEGAHAALNQLGIQLTKYSPTTKYYVSDPHGLLYDDLTYAFDSRGSSWLKSPEEFIAEMSYVRERSNAKPGFGFSQWAPNQQQQGIRFLSKEFEFTPEDTEYFLHKFSQFGFKNGGKIKNPQQ